LPKLAEALGQKKATDPVKGDGRNKVEIDGRAWIAELPEQRTRGGDILSEL